ncbi:YcnI family protein [Streptomyces sp. NPDC059740]|uniref:YcnI family copper-binding membrane protein n=1 Tax=Streptomyces sp. NPDC059740 TaxID=3346926 RepID=UPI0036585B0A
MSRKSVSSVPVSAAGTSARRSVRRLPLLAGLSAGGVLLLATPAFAHVTVNPAEAPKGSYATVNVKVPNERDNASTVKVEVDFDTSHPLASVMAQPVPGWKAEVTKKKLAEPVTVHGEKVDEAVSKITWTGGKINPGEFQQFPVSMGALPDDVDSLTFKALQTYSNHEVVRWIEPTKKGAPEPENPAPTLKLTAADTGDTGSTDNAGAASAHQDDSKAQAAPDEGGSDTTARVLGIVGIVVGVVGVAFAVLAGRRRQA